ncbi:MAG: hypothetical protein KKH92_08505 [Firmicutes bacterium]|nr:hypothetical protein [Bacillota bacterium]
MISTLFSLIFFFAFIAFVAGLISPQIFKFVLKEKANRKTISAILGGAMFVSIIIVGATAPPVEETENIQDEEQITEQKTDAEESPETESKTNGIANESEADITQDTPPEDEVDAGSNSDTEPATKSQREVVLEILKQNALDQWGDDFSMVKWELDGQTEAYDWIVKQTEYPSIMDNAKREWGDDYKMVKWEYEKQVEAFELL